MPMLTPGRAGLALVLAGALVTAWAGVEAPLCRSGRQQSPVDIVAPVRAELPALSFEYRKLPLLLANDGHTVRVRLRGAGPLRLGAQAYEIQELHFHTPAGDRLAGEEFPMAAHILHKDRSGQLLAVVLLFRVGAENPALAALWPHLPARVDGDHRIAAAALDVQSLLPASHAYYQYHGSLTATPCTENVRWIVLQHPVTLSAAQLAYWKSRFADNIRGPQPLHGRVVQASAS